MFSRFEGYLFVLFFLIAWQGFAQSREPLRKLESKVKNQFSSKKAVVDAFVRQRGISVVQQTADGRHLLLVDVENGIPVYLSGLNSGAAATTGASILQGGASGVKLEGDGMLVGVWDDGSIKGHVEFGDRIVSRELDGDETHATHVAGTIAASGVNPSAKGMAPRAKIASWYFNNDLAEMAALAQPDHTSLLFSNHSYGTVTGWTKINNVWNWTGDPSVSPDEDYRFGFYGEKAAGLDELANLAPYYTIVWAAGNDRGEPGDGSRPPDCNGGSGYDCIIPESVAKNIITVGAINKLVSYTGPASVVISNFSSWGPTDDGRIKPDLVGAGVNLLSSTADGVDSYGFLSGTSMATPNVTGSLVLLQEMYKKLHGGKVMKSATLKALAIHSAKEAGAMPGPDYRFGWGVLDVNEASKILIKEDGIQTMILEEELNQGEQFELTILPKANQKISATIVWNDPAATPLERSLDPVQLMLRNDLDIRLIAENGTVNYPWILDPSNPAGQAVKGDNFRDNVERLEFGFPEAKPYRLVVSHKGTLAGGNQPFSLILDYQSTQVGQTYFWIGDSGDWGNNNHWSLSSGGVAALEVPGVNDRVVVDENSFDGIGLDEITLSATHSCASLKWINSKSSALNLQNHNLQISQEISIMSGAFQSSGSGSIRFNRSDDFKGKIFLNDVSLAETSLNIDNGSWVLLGNGEVKRLSLNGGDLQIIDSQLVLNELNASSPETKQMRWDNTSVRLNGQSEISGDALTWTTNSSEIRIVERDVALNWHNVTFEGTLILSESNLAMTGSNAVHELRMDRSSLQLEGASTFAVDTISNLVSIESNPSRISAESKAKLTVRDHFLLCADFLEVSNVDLIGTARINVGQNGVVDNSNNWLGQTCETVLFADFLASDLCSNGFTQFVSTGTGLASSWQWSFGDGNSQSSDSEKNVFNSYDQPGTYEVTLAVSDGNQTHEAQKIIKIVQGSTSRNRIVVNSNELVSLNIAPEYQWFLNDEKIVSENERSFQYEGQTGLYRVVTDDGVCNRASDPLLITGVDGDFHSALISPNPAVDFVDIRTDRVSYVLTITDIIGRVYYQQAIVGDVRIPVNHLSEGIYFLILKSEARESRHKLLVRR